MSGGAQIRPVYDPRSIDSLTSIGASLGVEGGGASSSGGGSSGGGASSSASSITLVVVLETWTLKRFEVKVFGMDDIVDKF